MIRLFVGLDLPAPQAERLAKGGEGLPESRPVEARNLHLTLRFAGEIDEPAAADLDQALSRLRASPFTVALTGFGLFGGRRRPHALWRGVESAAPLLRLAERVEAAAIRAGLPPEPRRFIPHITLAWLKGTPPERLRFRLAEVPPPETLTVERITLFRSHLGRNGAEYERLATYALTGDGAPPDDLSEADRFG